MITLKYGAYGNYTIKRCRSVKDAKKFVLKHRSNTDYLAEIYHNEKLVEHLAFIRIVPWNELIGSGGTCSSMISPGYAEYKWENVD